MKILSLGLDASILDKNSALARRAIDYGQLVDEYTVIVPSLKKEKAELSEKVKVYGSGGGNKIAKLFNIYRLVKKLLAEGKYDVITVQDQYYLALIGVKLSKKFKVALEIQVHGFEKYRGLRKLVANYNLSRANAVRAVSQRLKKQLIDDFGVAENKITVVPIYSERTFLLPERSSQGVVEGQRSSEDPSMRRYAPYSGKKEKKNFIFLTVGRLVPVKNIGLQIEVMAEMVKEHPQAELWIVGDGPEHKNLKFKIEKLKLGDSVKLLGQKSREELNGLYQAADVFVLTSDSEGWGLAVVEAASYGLPIIMTDVGCAGEVIKNDVSGLVIPIGDKQGLSAAMLKIMEDEDLRKRLGDGAALAVSRLPSKEQTLGLYKRSWETAMANK